MRRRASAIGRIKRKPRWPCRSRPPVLIRICESLACRDKRSRAYRRAIGDPFDDRQPNVTQITPAARDGERYFFDSGAFRERSWAACIVSHTPPPPSAFSKRMAISGVTAPPSPR
jgi:hypothetical protein